MYPLFTIGNSFDPIACASSSMFNSGGVQLWSRPLCKDNNASATSLISFTSCWVKFGVERDMVTMYNFSNWLSKLTLWFVF